MRRSHDLGKTWSPEKAYFDTSKPDPSLAKTPNGSDDSGETRCTQIDYTSQIGVLQAPQLLQVRNALLLFGRQWDYVKLPHELVVFASYDGGSTFTDRTVLDTYTGLAIDGGYCSPLLRSDGKIFVVYYADSNNLQKPDIKSLVLHWNKN
jgi:hypothetical protein